MKGFSLIEVLLALVISSFVSLAILYMHIASIKQTQNAYFKSIALTELCNISEWLLINKDISNQGIQTEIQTLLPQGNSRIKRQGNGYLVSISWYSKNQSKFNSLSQFVLL